MLLYNYNSTVAIFSKDNAFIKNINEIFKDNLEYVEIYKDINLLLQNCKEKTLDIKNMIEIDSDDPIDISVKIKISELINIRKLKERHQEISVIILDLKSIDSDNQNILNELSKNHYIISVGSLTKSCSLYSSIYFDSYFIKTSDLNNEILKSVKTGMIYFLDKKYSIVKNSLLQLKQEDTALTNPIYKNIVNNYIKNNDVIEYYLMDKEGSYLMVHKNKNEQCLLVSLSSSKEAQVDMIEYQGFTDLISSIQKDEIMVYLHDQYFGNYKNISVLKEGNSDFKYSLISRERFNI